MLETADIFEDWDRLCDSVLGQKKIQKKIKLSRNNPTATSDHLEVWESFKDKFKYLEDSDSDSSDDRGKLHIAEDPESDIDDDIPVLRIPERKSKSLYNAPQESIIGSDSITLVEHASINEKYSLVSGRLINNSKRLFSPQSGALAFINGQEDVKSSGILNLADIAKMQGLNISDIEKGTKDAKTILRKKCEKNRGFDNAYTVELLCKF
ncbi:hypothetical protein HCN44_007182 [Aphidius gifuensis]|uniref:Uncharacterized protein n=1 Tax=Aphidius gifuensis TaxID=684658 RepID=A0A834XL47_APHGI|nr:hypothetical protein HCN44_007182 [Aphidius gifuensis]